MDPMGLFWYLWCKNQGTHGYPFFRTDWKVERLGSAHVRKKRGNIEPQDQRFNRKEDEEVGWVRHVPGLVNVYKKLWKDPPFLMGKTTIFMVILNSYVSHYQRVWEDQCHTIGHPHPHRWSQVSRLTRFGKSWDQGASRALSLLSWRTWYPFT